MKNTHTRTTDRFTSTVSSQRWALDALQENLETPGQLYHDNGRHIVYLAKEAGVQVQAIHVDLATLTTNYYTVTPEGKRVHGRS
jgi:hypothetical protein